MAKVIRCTCHSTESMTLEGAVYEVIFQTDEMYFTFGMFATEELAQQVADRGNSLLWPEVESSREIGFEIREHKLATAVMNVDSWSRQDFLDEIDSWDVEDYFRREPDPEDDED